MLETLAIRNYRTLRGFVIPLALLNLVTGANGTGKSNVYKALRLLAETAPGRAIAALAREGGLESALWAGPHAGRGEPVSRGLGFASAEFGDALDLGVAAPTGSAFSRDGVIEGEHVRAGGASPREGLLVERRNAVVRTRDENGKWPLVHQHLAGFDSMLSQLSGPRRTPELVALRDQFRAWRGRSTSRIARPSPWSPATSNRPRGTGGRADDAATRSRAHGVAK